MLLTIVVFVAILSVLVLIHELGHFLVAKKLGIKVEEFGFGFPPRVFSKKIGETLYSINLLPVGGFVRLLGEDAAGSGKVNLPGVGKTGDRRSKKTDSELRASSSQIKRAYFARPLWQRMLVVTAGVIMNFVLAVVVISFLFATQGVALPSDTVRVTDVISNSPAESAGLLIDDKLVSINEKELSSVEEFINETKEFIGEEIELEVARGNEEFIVSLTPRKEFPEGDGPIGVGISNIEIKKYSVIEAPFFGTIEAGKFTLLIVGGLYDMVSNIIVNGEKPEGVAGPIGVAQLTGQVVKIGFAAVLWFTALLSLNLAVLNILPIPALDGGRFFFMLIELFTGKKVNPRYEALAHTAGLAALLILIAVVTFFDISRLISGGSILP